MGLAIRALSNVKLLDVCDVKDPERDTLEQKYMKQKVEFIYYLDKFSVNDELPSGFYSYENIMYHSMGSYSGYGSFINILSEFCEKSSKKDSPFSELINYSDCEGFVGPITSKKLYSDFVKYKNQVIRFIQSNNEIGSENQMWYSQKYNDFISVLELAKNSGVLVFC
jgi:hypothetical protein